jgi:acetyltransferase
MADVSVWPKGLFEPEAVAVIGASDQSGSLGRLFVQNLLATYRGELYLVHPSCQTIANRAVYPSILDIPTVVDLAVVLVPSQAVERVIEQCVAAGVRAAVIISGGFAETGPEGACLQRRIVDIARSGGLRLIGPNCFGIINTRNGLNASLGLGLPGAGGVSLVTQSGAYGMAAFTRSREGEIGFAKVLALGNRADVDEVESLRYLGDDAETRVVAMLLETLGDGRGFL